MPHKTLREGKCLLLWLEHMIAFPHISSFSVGLAAMLVLTSPRHHGGFSVAGLRFWIEIKEENISAVLLVVVHNLVLSV